MGADFYDPPVADRRDPVGVASRRQPVGDDLRGASFAQAAQRCLDAALGAAVDREVASSSTSTAGSAR